MAHPYQEHKAHKHERERVSHITKGYAAGGAVEHDDAKEDRKMVKAMVRPSALKGKANGGAVSGVAPTPRADRPSRARGGRTGKKGHKTIVNVISHGGPTAPPGPAAGLGAVPPPIAAPSPMPPRPMMPPGGPPMAGPPGGGPMPPPGIRRHGGRAYAAGGAVKPGPAWNEGKRAGTQVQHRENKGDIGKEIGRPKPVTFAKGGRVDAVSQSVTSHKTPQKGSTPDGGGLPVKKGGMSPSPSSYAKGGEVKAAPRRLVKFWAGGGVPARATGGRIEAPGPGKAMGPKFGGGGHGGTARMAKAHRAAKRYHGPAPQSPTDNQ